MNAVSLLRFALPVHPLLGHFFLATLLWLSCGGGFSAVPAYAQLTVLSQGNTQLKWRESQLATLQQQLADADLGGELEQELQAQSKWLNAWQPGKLTEQSLWDGKPGLGGGKSEIKLWQEPTLDPRGKAKKLRQRLLGEKASPTIEDTRELQKLLAENDNDIGIRQLHLHWLDQQQYRKTYPLEIAEAAAKVIALLEAVAKPDGEIKLARTHCLYRRGRALAYRELPEVLEKQPLSPAQLEQNRAEMVGAYRQLKSAVPDFRPEFILLDIRMLRHDHWNGRALVLLEDFSSQLNQQWYLKKRRDLLRDLGWDGPAKEAEKIYSTAFPEALATESAGEE
jgi:hypothetical protein